MMKYNLQNSYNVYENTISTYCLLTFASPDINNVITSPIFCFGIYVSRLIKIAFSLFLHNFIGVVVHMAFIYVLGVFAVLYISHFLSILVSIYIHTLIYYQDGPRVSNGRSH